MLEKKARIIGALIAVALLLFTGCGKQAAPQAETNSDAPDNAPVEESAVATLDAYWQAVEDTLNANFENHHSMEISDDMVVINIWRDGLANEAASVINAGLTEIPEGWNNIVSSFSKLSAEIQSGLNNGGYGNITVLTNVVSDLDHTTRLCSIMRDSVVYDLLNGIDLLNPAEDTETTPPVDERLEAQEALKAALSDGYVSFSRSVDDDVTGRWRLLLYASGEDILNHVVDYYRAYFEDDSEVHVVVNLGLRTTTVINVFGDSLYVDVHEYVDKEEHNAKTLGGGTLLKSYIVTISTGEIEDII